MASLPTPELATASDLVEFLEDQHVAIRTLFDAALSPEKGIDSGSFTRLRGLLAVHETVEAMVVHPWSRGISEAGRTVANTRLAEELALTTDLEQLEATAVGSPKFIVGLAALRSATLEHCRLEEEEEFPMLSGELGPVDRRRAGLAVGMSEWFAPAPERSPAESTIASPTHGPYGEMAARVRDILAAV